MAKLLLVEDDPALSGMIEDWLKHENYSVEVALNGRDGREKIQFYEFDLFIIDWDLPEVSGIEICREYRAQGGNVPILMLTGKNSISEKETGLDAGADDYLTKPFNMRELSARLRALLRRSSASPTNILKAGDFTLDPISYLVTRAGKEISLQRREFALLEFLMRNPNRVFSPESLLDRVWASESDATVEAIRTCMKRLRQKIDVEGEQSIIKTVHGVGYKLVP